MVYNILRLPQVKSETGLSRSAIYQRISEGSFPKQINLGSRAVGWLTSDIENWIKQRVIESKEKKFCSANQK
jgi:prophage regulatory protein